MIRRYILSAIGCMAMIVASGANPTATTYSTDDCQGSLKPYPTPASIVEYPDSLTPVMINHVGRHGARFPASSSHSLQLLGVLQRADSAGTITPTGRQLMKLTQYVIDKSDGQWGALDSLGMAEQRGIAARMYTAYPELMLQGPISALSSYSPRCVMSMYSFCHQLTRMNNRVEIIASSGRQYSDLMRPFDLDQDYLDFRKDNVWAPPYDEYMDATVPVSGLRRAIGDLPMSDHEAREMALMEYYVLAGLSAMSINADLSQYLTLDELNKLWSTFNLRQYLQRTATTVSSIPADIAAPLLNDLITTTSAVAEGRQGGKVLLRFGHAETLMPLLSLMRLPGCYYMTNYFDTVALHWKDFDVVPLASNLQLILFKAKKSGRYYLRVDLNERPITLMPNSTTIYLPWGEARNYLTRCLPLYMQI